MDSFKPKIPSQLDYLNHHPAGTVIRPSSVSAPPPDIPSPAVPIPPPPVTPETLESTKPEQLEPKTPMEPLTPTPVKPITTTPALQPVAVPVMTAAAVVTPKPSITEPRPSRFAGPKEKLAAIKAKNLHKNKYLLIAAGVFSIILLIAGSTLLMQKLLPAKQAVVTKDGEGNDTSGVLMIDTKNQAVGVVSKNPNGLQIEAIVGADPLGLANVRLGLTADSKIPSLILENESSQAWRVSNVDDSLQFLQGNEMRAKLDKGGLSVPGTASFGGATNINGNTTLGNEGGDTLSIQGVAVAVPNGLNIDNNTLFIDAAKHNVSIGVTNSAGYKLLVSGTFKATGAIATDAQITATTGNAGVASFTWAGNGNTGLFRPSVNVVGITAGGAEVLRVQQGAVLALNGANIEAEGFIRAGRDASNPAWRVQRYMGNLDGSGSASIGHSIANAQARILSAEAYYKGNSGEAVPMSVEAINGSTITISGGVAGRMYRVTVMYSQDTPAW